MPDSKPLADKNPSKEGAPVMFCQTAQGGGSSKRLARALPIDPRRGRKGTRRMSELMFFRCTTDDRTTIETNASKAGLERSSYMRAQSTGRPRMKACRRVRADWDELKRCMGVINKAGNVVNQLVVELRRFRQCPDLANAALNELIAAARAIVAALREI